MATRLAKPLAREVEADGAAYVLRLTPMGLRLAAKGRRKGSELRWTHLLGGKAALATAPNASLGRLEPRT